MIRLSAKGTDKLQFSTHFFLGLKVFFLSKKAPKLAAMFMARADSRCARRHWPETGDESPLVTSAATVISAALNRCLLWLHYLHFYFLFTVSAIFQGFQMIKNLFPTINESSSTLQYLK